MAEPALQLPDDDIEPVEPSDPDVLYMPGAEPPPESVADDGQTIDARPQINERLEQQKRAKAQSEVEKVKSGEQKLKKATSTPTAGKSKFGEAAAGAALSGGGDKEDRKERAKEALKEEAKQQAKQYAKQIARQAGATIKKAAVEAIAATSEFWVPALVIILIIIAIVAIIFVLFSFDGDGGKGPAQYPETALQRQHSNFLLAISGDKIASDVAVKEVIDSELERYDRIKTNADRFNPDLSTTIAAKKIELDGKLMGLLIEKSVDRRKVLRDQFQGEMRAFEATLPFGSWIAALAEERVGQPNLQFCSITGATAKVACASFTSTIMYLAGVPNAIVGNTTEVWNNSALKVVIDRSPAPTAGQYDPAKLQPGDIIWWGNGSCSSVKYSGKLFDHVGFYVGNGMAIDTSSSRETVEKRSAPRRDSCRLFNGAKRYGR